MSDDFEETLLTDGGKWWEFLDPETYEVRDDLPTVSRSSSDKLDWSRIETRRPGPVGFAYFNHCSDCGQGVPPDFTFCVHCGGDPRSADRMKTYSVVIAELEGDGHDAAVELFSAVDAEIDAAEVDAIVSELPAVFNVTARRDQAAALVAKMAEVGIRARTFGVDDPSIPWIREAIESIVRQPPKLLGMVAVLVGAVAASVFWSLAAIPFAVIIVGALIGLELRWYRRHYHVDVRRLLELLTGFDAETARIARETLRSLADRDARRYVTVCLMEYYTLTQQLRSHQSVYGDVLDNARFALESLMADVLTLAHRYAGLDSFVAAHPAAKLEQRIEDRRIQKTEDRQAARMLEQEIEVLEDQLRQVRAMEESRRAFRERLASLARSMEQLRTRIASVRARSSAHGWNDLGVDETLRDLEREFEVFEETFAAMER
jgi:hypothetical protein